MKQKQRIINYFKTGKKLTTLQAVYKGMGTRLPNRVIELEQEFGVRFTRIPKQNKKTNTRWLEFSLPKNQLKLLK